MLNNNKNYIDRLTDKYQWPSSQLLRETTYAEQYYKSKLELKSNSSEILPVNCKLICDSTLFKTQS